MKQYCLGFAFTSDFKSVLLIKKNRPDWQAGKVNGVGGKLEENEMSNSAMVREFEEETGIKTNVDDWESIGSISRIGSNFEDFHIQVYATSKVDVSTAKSMTDEEVSLYSLTEGKQLDSRIPQLEKLDWLLPYSIDSLKNTMYCHTSYLHKSLK